MIYNFEYELKIMLSQPEYEKLLSYTGCDSFKQVNYYFDTPDFDMYDNKTVIRIRVTDGDYELTVKTKRPGGSAEGVVSMDENNVIIKEDTAAMILGGKADICRYLPLNDVYEGKKLVNVGMITTIRKKIRINDNLPMAELDKSIYCETADYELEWEISEEKYNMAVESLQKAGITLDGRRKGLSKYGRLVDRLKEDK